MARDTELYPELLPKFEQPWRLNPIWFSQLSLNKTVRCQTFLLNQTTYLDQTLATYYDLSVTASSSFEPVDLSAETRFGGLWGRGIDDGSCATHEFSSFIVVCWFVNASCVRSCHHHQRTWIHRHHRLTQRSVPENDMPSTLQTPPVQGVMN